VKILNRRPLDIEKQDSKRRIFDSEVDIDQGLFFGKYRGFGTGRDCALFWQLAVFAGSARGFDR
jgi:hypothetical protein